MEQRPWGLVITLSQARSAQWVIACLLLVEAGLWYLGPYGPEHSLDRVGYWILTGAIGLFVALLAAASVYGEVYTIAPDELLWKSSDGILITRKSTVVRWRWRQITSYRRRYPVFAYQLHMILADGQLFPKPFEFVRRKSSSKFLALLKPVLTAELEPLEDDSAGHGQSNSQP